MSTRPRPKLKVYSHVARPAQLAGPIVGAPGVGRAQVSPMVGGVGGSPHALTNPPGRKVAGGVGLQCADEPSGGVLESFGSQSVVQSLAARPSPPASAHGLSELPRVDVEPPSFGPPSPPHPSQDPEALGLSTPRHPPPPPPARCEYEPGSSPCAQDTHNSDLEPAFAARSESCCLPPRPSVPPARRPATEIVDHGDSNPARCNPSSHDESSFEAGHLQRVHNAAPGSSAAYCGSGIESVSNRMDSLSTSKGGTHALSAELGSAPSRPPARGYPPGAAHNAESRSKRSYTMGISNPDPLATGPRRPLPPTRPKPPRRSTNASLASARNATSAHGPGFAIEDEVLSPPGHGAAVGEPGADREVGAPAGPLKPPRPTRRQVEQAKQGGAKVPPVPDVSDLPPAPLPPGPAPRASSISNVAPRGTFAPSAFPIGSSSEVVAPGSLNDEDMSADERYAYLTILHEVLENDTRSQTTLVAKLGRENSLLEDLLRNLESTRVHRQTATSLSALNLRTQGQHTCVKLACESMALMNEVVPKDPRGQQALSAWAQDHSRYIDIDIDAEDKAAEKIFATRLPRSARGRRAKAGKPSKSGARRKKRPDDVQQEGWSSVVGEGDDEGPERSSSPAVNRVVRPVQRPSLPSVSPRAVARAFSPAALPGGLRPEASISSPVFKFEVVKVNKVHRNTPRILELNLRDKACCICKFEESTLQREVVAKVTPDMLVSLIRDDQSHVLIQVSYLREAHVGGVENKEKKTSTLKRFVSRKNTQDDKDAVKHFRAIFMSPEERERFFRLINRDFFKVEKSTPFVPIPLTLKRPEALTSFNKKFERLPVELMALQVHQSWTKQRLRDGWVFGRAKDPGKKTDPAIVPYGDLRNDERRDLRRVVRLVLESMYTIGFEPAKHRSAEPLPPLPSSLKPLLEFLAANIHMDWAARRFDEGWEYGMFADLKMKTHPNLRHFKFVDKSERWYPKAAVAIVFDVLSRNFYAIKKSKVDNSVFVQAFGGETSTLTKTRKHSSIGGV